MPSYKTHAIHGELILPKIESKVEIKSKDFKTYCFGPDALIASDYKLFFYQHRHKVKIFFEKLVDYIKENKLQDNSEVMAFLYGQLDHYIVDIICHPLIIYMTEGMPRKYNTPPHALIEMWIDNYIMAKYDKKEKNYLQKWIINDKELRKLINELYSKIYMAKNEAIKYSLGITITNLLDSVIRMNGIGIVPLLLKTFNFGDITCKDFEAVLPYLNLDHQKWNNPISGEELNLSFEDLWNKTFEVSLEAISDINKCLYHGEKITNKFIINDCSYVTGIPCEQEVKYKLVKEYKRAY